MAGRKTERGTRLAAALKQNLKRRKAGSPATGEETDSPAAAGIGPAAGTAPQGGVKQTAGPKTASKRN